MTDEPTAKAIQVKLVLLGEAAVGKSSLVLRFVQDDFNENNSPTIGAAFLTQKCRLEDKVIKFEIWDTAGQERFHSLAPMYYRNAAAAVVVYDLTKASSLDKAKTWITELQRQANPNIVIALVGNKADLIDDNLSTGTVKGDAEGEGQGEGTELVSPFGTKSAGTQGDDDDNDNDNDDEEGEERNVEPTSTAAEVKSSNARQVSKEEVEVYAREQGGILLFEASAKTGKGVQEVFTEIAKNLPIESMQSKPTGSTTGNAGNRRGAAGAAAGDSGRVNLGASAGGEAGKKSGGCC